VASRPCNAGARRQHPWEAVTHRWSSLSLNAWVSISSGAVSRLGAAHRILSECSSLRAPWQADTTPNCLPAASLLTEPRDGCVYVLCDDSFPHSCVANPQGELPGRLPYLCGHTMGWVVGETGVVMFTADAGATWTRQTNFDLLLNDEVTDEGLSVTTLHGIKVREPFSPTDPPSQPPSPTTVLGAVAKPSDGAVREL